MRISSLICKSSSPLPGLSHLNCRIAHHIVTADFSYDQEEVPAKVEPPMKFEIPPEAVDPPDRNGMVSDRAMLDLKEEPGPEISERRHYENSNDMNGDIGTGWQDGHTASGNGHGYESAVEPESHGTGIKEDG